MKKKLTGVALVLAAVSLMGIQPAGACTRAVYLGPDRMVVTGRTMDWKEDIMSNIYVFPRGMQRAGHNKEKTVNWTSKYGSIVASAYDLGICDGMNEKGLVASLLFLPESIYTRPNDTRPVMGIGIWTQYVLDNFVWTDNMELIAQKLQKISKTLNGRTESELAQKLLKE